MTEKHHKLRPSIEQKEQEAMEEFLYFDDSYGETDVLLKRLEDSSSVILNLQVEGTSIRVVSTLFDELLSKRSFAFHPQRRE